MRRGPGTPDVIAARQGYSTGDPRIAQVQHPALGVDYLPNWSTSLQRADVGPYPFSHGVSHIVQIGFEAPLPYMENLVDRKTYAQALESKSFSKKSLSLIGLPHAKTTDDSR